MLSTVDSLRSNIMLLLVPIESSLCKGMSSINIKGTAFNDIVLSLASVTVAIYSVWSTRDVMTRSSFDKPQL